MPAAARQVEHVKQGIGCFPGVVKLNPVSSTRNDRMFEEVTLFSKNLTACEKQIQALKKAADGMMKVSDRVLSGPFPQIYEKNAVTGEAEVWADGLDKPHQGMEIKDTSVRLQQEVLDPIAAWQAEYLKVKKRMSEVSKVSAELDIARRAFYKQHKKHQKQFLKNSNDPTAVTAPREENDPKLTAARQQYIGIEEAVHQELIVLVRHTRAVHQFLTRAMHLEAQALRETALSHTPPDKGTLQIAPPSPISPMALPAGSPTMMLPPAPVASPMEPVPMAPHHPVGQLNNEPNMMPAAPNHTIPGNNMQQPIAQPAM